MLKIVKPTADYKNKIIDYINEFKFEKEVIHGGARIEQFEFEEWLIILKNNMKEDTVEKGFVPSSTFISVDDRNNVVGIVDIRHRLNDFLRKFGGHIGYSVRKSERNKGYATEILRLALLEFKKISKENCLIICEKSNKASSKVIIKNGGLLEEEIFKDDVCFQKYIIKFDTK